MAGGLLKNPQGTSARKELFGKVVQTCQCLPDKGQPHYSSIPEGVHRGSDKIVLTHWNMGSDLEVPKI